MNIQVEKRTLIKHLAKVQDAAIITQIKELLGISDDPIVGYEINGNPITKSELNQSLKEARKRYKAGKYTTQKDLEKEINDW